MFVVLAGSSGIFWDTVQRLGTGLHERTFVGQYAWEFADYSAGKISNVHLYLYACILRSISMKHMYYLAGCKRVLRTAGSGCLC